MGSFHVILLYAGILGLLLVVLSFNMMKCWVRAAGMGKQSDPDLSRAEALVSSFTDYVPLTLFLMAGAEANGAPVGATGSEGGAARGAFLGTARGRQSGQMSSRQCSFLGRACAL